MSLPDRRASMQEYLAASALRLLEERPETPFSHESVASLAGVSARTVYRYFPAQSDLIAAVWRHLRDTTGTRWPESELQILPSLVELFAQFERNDTLTRAMIAALPKADYSQHGSAEGRLAFRNALRTRLDRLDEEAGDRLVASCVAIYSAPFWQMLRDRGQLSAAQASAAACELMRTLLAGQPAERQSPPPPAAASQVVPADVTPTATRSTP